VTALVSVLALRANAEPLDLTGTWFVLIHYRDSATENPDADRWEDRVWVFEPKGSRFEWRDYSIVVLQDESGRFESRGGNLRARTLEAWEPNPAQLAELLGGPHVNSRGSKTKTLRGSHEKGWESMGDLSAQSAMVIGYHETWRIQDPGGLPVFEREDVMSSGIQRTRKGEDQGLSGLTRYKVTQVDERGLSGEFQRDENRRGTFRMFRTAATRGLESDGKTPNQKLTEQATEAYLKAEEERLRKGIDEGDPEALREVKELMQKKQQNLP
jgi:hypothetical protein